MESKPKKFDVAIKVTSPYQEDVNDITDLRETIQKCIEQKLGELPDVEIVDSNQNRWDYFIQIVYSIPSNNESLIQNIKMLICIYDTKAFIGFYDPIIMLLKNQLDIYCKDFVELFNSLYLERARKDA